MAVKTATSGLEELVRGRRSIRAFLPTAVPRELVRELLQAVLWAPSPHNVQPWRFAVLFAGPDKERLSTAMAHRLAAELRADGADETAIEQQTSRSRGRILSAPVAVICSLVPDGLVEYGDRKRTRLEWQMAVQSVGAVLQTLFLLAFERGLGTCWMAAPMYCPDEVRSALSLPQNYEPQALVLMGYPAREGKMRARRPLGEVVDLR